MGAPVSFENPAALRAWLVKNHAKASELVMRVWKVHAAARGVTNSQAVDEMLCFGWIDGIRHALDEDSFRVRFTPRTPTSIWSAVNIRRYAELEAEGRVTAAGKAAFGARSEARSRVYSFEQKQTLALAPAMQAQMRADARAWAFWKSCPPWYHRACAHWILSAKQEGTRQRRLDKLIESSRRGTGIPPIGDKVGRKKATKDTVSSSRPARARARRGR